MLTKRQGIIVWVKHIKQLRKLRRYGHVIYGSKRRKYVLLYVNQEQVEEVMDQLNQLNFVKQVEPSYKPYIDTVYQSKEEKDLEMEEEWESFYKSS
ncbi:YlbG family protein [Alkalibacillus aidingensis]|uniref:YlbG family protein n=1 Tax=Alkalibacillus aidingensis TaxID=2747607 RepID=UPI001660F2A3|nr:DUF2129 domain-containing protein [Alkalibacillus aidingensis]